MASPMEVRGIGLTSHSANQYVIIKFYLPGKDGRIAYFQREVHLINNLKANLLMGIDILSPENIYIDPSREIATIRSCEDVQLALFIKIRSEKI